MVKKFAYEKEFKRDFQRRGKSETEAKKKGFQCLLCVVIGLLNDSLDSSCRVASIVQYCVFVYAVRVERNNRP